MIRPPLAWVGPTGVGCVGWEPPKKARFRVRFTEQIACRDPDHQILRNQDTVFERPTSVGIPT